MFKSKIQVKKGVVLLIVLGTILLVVILANIILSTMSSQSRLTHHQVSRIQAYYAAMAGINYAFESIRLNDANWIPAPDVFPNTRTRILCRGCVLPNVNEPELPNSIQQVTITIGAPNSGISGTREVRATATYIYSP